MNDAGIAVQNMLRGASAHALGACFFGAPSGQLSASAIALGWPHPEECHVSPKRPRQPATDLIHKEAW